MLDTFVGVATPLTRLQLDNAAKIVNIPAQWLWAVYTVETAGYGFLPSRKPKILFERHIFYRYIKRPIDDISDPQPGGYGAGGEHQYERLEKALEVDYDAALMAASWGIGQVMGFNYKYASFDTVEAFVSAMRISEELQLLASLSFMCNANPRMLNALRNSDWKTFARMYNGPNYANNKYDLKLHGASQMPLPDFDVRAQRLTASYGA